jgi:ABC-type antimicrobial peptide transport system permease subunit
MTADALRGALQARLGRLHPEVFVAVRTFQTAIDNSVVRERLLALLSGLFGVAAGLLAAIGLYGLMAYLTARRAGEIGIRLALGARRGTIVGMILKEAALLLAAGAAIGLLGTIALERTVASLLFGLQPRDPLTYTAAVALLTGAVALGSYLPARRASRVDPTTALRWE